MIKSALIFIKLYVGSSLFFIHRKKQGLKKVLMGDRMFDFSLTRSCISQSWKRSFCQFSSLMWLFSIYWAVHLNMGMLSILQIWIVINVYKTETMKLRNDKSIDSHVIWNHLHNFLGIVRKCKSAKMIWNSQIVVMKHNQVIVVWYLN